MVRQTSRLTITGILLALSACAASPDLAVRERSQGLASGSHPVEFRLAEARSHFRLGNIALAAEGFRRALRESPSSVDAMNGLAACYDRMGRFDLSRRYYERALALSPGDPRLYANLATSLALQGRTEEAASVRAEMAGRLGTDNQATIALAPSVPLLPAQGMESITVPLSVPASAVTLALAGLAPPPTPAPSPLPARPEAPSFATPANADGPRLERMDLAEVLLVTDRVRSAFVAPPAATHVGPRPRTAAATIPPGRTSVTLLNAARVNRLAANTRVRLHRLGWREVAIGNATRVASRSEVAFPERRRAEAERLARQLGIAARPAGAATGDRLVIILGRDVARRRTGA